MFKVVQVLHIDKDSNALEIFHLSNHSALSFFKMTHIFKNYQEIPNFPLYLSLIALVSALLLLWEKLVVY